MIVACGLQPRHPPGIFSGDELSRKVGLSKNVINSGVFCFLNHLITPLVAITERRSNLLRATICALGAESSLKRDQYHWRAA